MLLDDIRLIWLNAFDRADKATCMRCDSSIGLRIIWPVAECDCSKCVPLTDVYAMGIILWVSFDNCIQSFDVGILFYFEDLIIVTTLF